MIEEIDYTQNFFVFQGNSLATLSGFSDSGFPGKTTVPGEKAIEIFSRIEGADFFSIPSIDTSSLDGMPFIQALTLPADLNLSDEWELLPMRRVLDLFVSGSGGDYGLTGEGLAGRLLRAYHISLWRNESKFCGSCGSKNADADTGEVARQCPRCGRMEFPRIAPAVITLITNDRDEALLAHNCKFTNGMYSLIAGFNEAGEDLESTVAREIREEVGIEVKDIRYIASQPWPFPNSLMLGFAAKYCSGVIRPNGTEIEDARWFKRDELPMLPGPASISRYLIELWREKKLRVE